MILQYYFKNDYQRTYDGKYQEEHRKQANSTVQVPIPLYYILEWPPAAGEDPADKGAGVFEEIIEKIRPG